MVNMHQHPQNQNLPTKDHDWAHFFRLVSISGVATLSTIGNIFTISSIIVDDLLRKKGNSFLVSYTLADLLITALVLPATAVAILAQIEDSENLCRFQYGIGTMSCVTAAIFTAVVGIENFLRLRSFRNLESERERRRGQPMLVNVHLLPQQEKQSLCSQFQVTLINLIIWILSAIIVLAHFNTMPQLMVAICSKSKLEPLIQEEESELLESLIIFGAFLLLFILLGGLGLLKCVCIMRSWTKPMPYITAREFALINSNFWNWLVRFLIFCPSIVAAILTQMERSSMTNPTSFSTSITTTTTTTAMTTTMRIGETSTSTKSSVEIDADLLALQRLIYWPAILPSCLGSLVYACANADYRRCYIQLFNYCCCKTSVTLSRRPQAPRGGSDVRVHIIPGYNIYSSGTAGHSSSEVTTTPPRFNTFKINPVMSCRRDVYEL